MATTSTKAGLSITPADLSNRLMSVNTTPRGFDAARDLPAGFLEFLAPLHAALTLRQRALVARRETALHEAHAGKQPDYLPPSVATMQPWQIAKGGFFRKTWNGVSGPMNSRQFSQVPKHTRSISSTFRFILAFRRGW